MEPACEHDPGPYTSFELREQYCPLRSYRDGAASRAITLEGPNSGSARRFVSSELHIQAGFCSTLNSPSCGSRCFPIGLFRSLFACLSGAIQLSAFGAGLASGPELLEFLLRQVLDADVAVLGGTRSNELV